MPSVSAQLVPEAESRLQRKEDELLDLPDVPSRAPVMGDDGAKDISTEVATRTQGLSLST